MSVLCRSSPLQSIGRQGFFAYSAVRHPCHQLVLSNSGPALLKARTRTSVNKVPGPTGRGGYAGHHLRLPNAPRPGPPVVAVSKGAEAGTTGRRRTAPSGGSAGRGVQQQQQQNRKPLKDLVQGVNLPVSVDAMAEQSQKVLGEAQSQWERVEDKPSVLLLAGVGVLGLYLAAVLLDGLDRVPLLGALMEGVGLGVVAMYAYKWFSSPEERSGIRDQLRGVLAKLGVDVRE